MLGDKWPLTTEDGVLDCRDPLGAGGPKIVMLTGGTVYAINGTAKSFAAKNGWSLPDAIILPGKITGTIMSTLPLVDAGRALCP